MTRAEQNALAVSYEVMGTRVDLDLPFVKRYLVRGAADKVSDQEVVFFMNTCKAQGLNPLAQGEVYLIKFGNDPAQMVVGKDAYLRRAHDHPDYLYKQDGIVVQRGEQVLQKEGCCLYPGEVLLGGWCRVYFKRGGSERVTFKEVALSEYNKGMANWNTKPATMICKVAVSQCLRDAFPKEFEGVYSEDEMVAAGAISAEYMVMEDKPTAPAAQQQKPVEADPVITQEQRQELFRSAQSAFGREEGNTVIRELITSLGLQSTSGMTQSQYRDVTERLEALYDEQQTMMDLDGSNEQPD